MRITLSTKCLYDRGQVERMFEWYEVLRKDLRKLTFAAEQNDSVSSTELYSLVECAGIHLEQVYRRPGSPDLGLITPETWSITRACHQLFHAKGADPAGGL